MASSRFLLERASTAATGNAEVIQGQGPFTIEASGLTTAGAGTADVDVLVSNQKTGPWAVAGNFNMVLSTVISVGTLPVVANWPYAQARVNSITGTGAEVTISIGWR